MPRRSTPSRTTPSRTTPNSAAPAEDWPVRVRIDLGYDGAGFHGWAAQPGVRTVQEVLENALRLVLRLAEPPALVVAGRTDAGVHARGQVAHCDMPAACWSAVADRAVGRLNRLLPPDLRVRALAEVPAGFDARFSALWRRYSYRVCDDLAFVDPVRRRDTLWHPRPLDLAAMNAAAGACLGEHDFAAFCRRRPGASTIRELFRLDWQRVGQGVAVGTVVADAFCHNMVRALTGALLAVGDGRRPPEWLAEVLAARVRNPAVTVAPPHPLCLEEVGYPDPGQYAVRAARTRRVRGDPTARHPTARDPDVAPDG